MFKEKTAIKGKITVKVFDKDGNIKRFKPNWIDRVLGKEGRPMIAVNHNLVTDQGDAIVADIMAETPARTKFNNANAYMSLGTGFASATKGTTGLTTQIGGSQGMEATYPVLKGAFGAANDNVTTYRTIFAAGTCTSSGIDEVALKNNATQTSGDCLAYAEITPAVNKGASDSLQVDWEVTFLGA